MTNHTRILRSTVLGAAAAIALLLLSATPALAAHPAGKGNNSPSSHGGGSSTPTGNDISYPQCGGSFPSGQAFGIVGVNGGLANNLNPCLGPYGSAGASSSELYWAATTSSGAVNQQGGSQPNAGLYVNTADPGNTASDWPNAGAYVGDPYTDSTSTASYCDGGNTQACAWAYGDSKAVQDGQWLEAAAAAVNTASGSPTLPTSASAYPWWLDIQTANTWQSGTGGQAMNIADIQGMLAGLESFGTMTYPIGIYSTSYQWGQIVGSPSATTFPTLPDWIPGARKLSQAESNCSLTGFTGPVTVTQWFGHPFDGDYACS